MTTIGWDCQSLSLSLFLGQNEDKLYPFVFQFARKWRLWIRNQRWICVLFISAVIKKESLYCWGVLGKCWFKIWAEIVQYPFWKHGAVAHPSRRDLRIFSFIVYSCLIVIGIWMFINAHYVWDETHDRLPNVTSEPFPHHLEHLNAALLFKIFPIAALSFH